MAYGLTFEDVQRISSPHARQESWGKLTALTSSPYYSFYRLELDPGSVQPLHFFTHGSGKLFAESGSAVVRLLDAAGKPKVGGLDQGTCLSLPPYSVHSLASMDGAVLYMAGPRVSEYLSEVVVEEQNTACSIVQALDASALEGIGEPTTDVREKYWGRIETILDSEVAAKRIFVQKGGQSSMEFHVEKFETYYVHSGLLKVGLRVGRAENRSIVMEAGQAYDVTPGIMHMRIALEDTVIIEASTKDSDADSFLVEDGQTYRHVEIA